MKVETNSCLRENTSNRHQKEGGIEEETTEFRTVKVSLWKWSDHQSPLKVKVPQISADSLRKRQQ